MNASSPAPDPSEAPPDESAGNGSAEARDGRNFIEEIIDRDLAEGRHDSVVTRFPPEPNGYPHIGHAKSIVLNFGLAEQYGGRCHLRFDDTNPETESMEYVEAIEDAVRWLGYDWGEHLYFASDYFEQFYDYAEKLLRQGDAYVDSLDEEEMREMRGTVNEPGTPSPYRDRSVEENLDLFRGMRAGEFENGEHVLRARIDMASPHMIMRDPLLYRIRHAEHYRRGDEWCIYPMYDFAHCLEDAIEDVTHSLCTLEFDTNRVLYDWVLEHCLEEHELPSRPHQYEFAPLDLEYTVMSKRKLRRLIEAGRVAGWDDPRLSSIAGMRRRGVTPEAVRTFCRDVGVTRSESRVEMGRFEHALRDDLNFKAPRVMGVVDPLPVTVTNFPEGETRWLQAPHWPRDIDRADSREVPFTRSLYIDRDDFRVDPPDDFIRLAPGREVRLRYACFLTCEDVVRGEDGEIEELRCTYDPETWGGEAPDGRSPEGTLHWVSAEHGRSVEMRTYDRLFEVPDPDARDEPFEEFLNPESLVGSRGVVEPSVADDPPETRYQFERRGYYWRDPVDSDEEAPVFNQIVPLRDSWAEEDEIREKDLDRLREEKEREKERHRRRSIQAQRDPAEMLEGEDLRRYEQYRERFDLNREEAVVLAGDERAADFFERALEVYHEPASVGRWVANDLMRVWKERDPDALPFGPTELGRLVRLADEGVVSGRGADEVFGVLVEEGGDPEAIVERRDLRQVEDEEQLAPLVREILEAHPEEVRRYRDGKTGLLGFFMGRLMRETGGRASPELAKDLLRRALEE